MAIVATIMNRLCASDLRRNQNAAATSAEGQRTRERRRIDHCAAIARASSPKG
jgi:hypothetical protein